MFTFESSICCDRCRRRCVNGEEKADHDESIRSAENAALREGWQRIGRAKWMCGECAKLSGVGMVEQEVLI